MGQVMNAHSQLEEKTISGEFLGFNLLDQLLQSLVTEFSYSQVLDHLVQVGGKLNRPMPSATYLMTLTPEEREPFLKAAVDEALPLYMEDLAKPEAERVLTADLASDFLEEFPQDEDTIV